METIYKAYDEVQTEVSSPQNFTRTAIDMSGNLNLIAVASKGRVETTTSSQLCCIHSTSISRRRVTALNFAVGCSLIQAGGGDNKDIILTAFSSTPELKATTSLPARVM